MLKHEKRFFNDNFLFCLLKYKNQAQPNPKKFKVILEGQDSVELLSVMTRRDNNSQIEPQPSGSGMQSNGSDRIRSILDADTEDDELDPFDGEILSDFELMAPFQLEPHAAADVFASLNTDPFGFNLESERRNPRFNARYNNEKEFKKTFDVLAKQSPDVTFIVKSVAGDAKYMAHQCVLSQLSPVFKDMFKGEPKQPTEIRIPDISSAAFEEFLQFFYHYIVKLTMTNINDVLNLLHQYKVQSGSQICSDFIQSNLTAENFIWASCVAVKYGFHDLRQICLKEFHVSK